MATKKSSKKDPLKSKTEWTITEFQMWLHGAYSLQGEDWVPTEDQWRTIVDIIYKLKNRAPAPKPVQPPMYGAPPMMAPQHPPMEYGGGGGGLMATEGTGLLGPVDTAPTEAGMSLSEIRRLREGGSANSNVLAGNAPPGEKAIKTGSFE